MRILPRYIIENNGIRPFQQETIDAIKSRRHKNIIVEAPVGSGKSYVIKLIIDFIQKMIKTDKNKNFILLLTYPTKILINAQINSLKKILSSEYTIKYWLDDQIDLCSNSNQADITIFEYSTDSLSNFFYKKIKKTQQENKSFIDVYNDLSSDEFIDINIQPYDKGFLIYNMLINHLNHSRCNIFVLTPDVLYLLVKRYYRKSNEIMLLIKDAIVVFDEFHLYNFENFGVLAKEINQLGCQSLFLSATPIIDYIPDDIDNKYISFTKSISKDNLEGSKIFNYELEVEIEPCNRMSLSEITGKIINKNYIETLEKPLAIIFDSIFRLRHIKPQIESKYNDKYKILEYSGMYKSAGLSLTDNNTIILGTSSIEVGINMPIKSLIIEASHWTSAIQRIGRIGRFSKGRVIILTKYRLDASCLLSEYSRDDFENIIKECLLSPVKQQIAGEMFRGNSYSFILIEGKNNNITFYNETIFCMFEIDEIVDNWQKIDIIKKQKILKSYNLNKDIIEQILIKDAIVPFYGIVIARKLKNEYSNITAKEKNGYLIIERDDKTSYYFETRGNKIK